MSKLTADQAEARAVEWEAQRRDYERRPRADYFREASALDVVDMWRTQKNLDGRRLTKFEFGCLVERWTEIFGKSRKLMAIRQAMTLQARLSQCRQTTQCFACPTLCALRASHIRRSSVCKRTGVSPKPCV